MSSLNFSYVINHDVKPSELATLYEKSGLYRTSDVSKISTMISNANLIIAARHHRRLIGIIRGFTDFCHSCYVADFVIDAGYRNMGVGKKLLDALRESLGVGTEVLFLGSGQESFYSCLGLERAHDSWRLPQELDRSLS